jgi:hypothetical protein
MILYRHERYGLCHVAVNRRSWLGESLMGVMSLSRPADCLHSSKRDHVGRYPRPKVSADPEIRDRRSSANNGY